MELSMACPYEYQDLVGEQAFRLLKVHGNDDPDSPLSCELVESQLDNNTPPYEAISYCWGDNTLSCKIICNGHLLSVTRNCEAALRRFRPLAQGTSRLVWIDAICINQSNMGERNNQVQLMGAIYGGAVCVLIWLGDVDACNGQRGFSVSQLCVKTFAWLAALAEAAMCAEIDAREECVLRVADKADKDGLEKFLAAVPWFKRFWIIQEVVLSKKATLTYGRAEASLNGILEARLVLMGMGNQGHQRAASAAATLWKLFAVHDLGKRTLESARQSYRPDIVEVKAFLTEARFSMATKSEDKAFGLYGLLKSSKIQVPPVDYGKSIATIYRETTAAIIEATNSLQIIQLVDGLGSTPQKASWVPDWSSSKHCIGPGARPTRAAADSEPVFRLIDQSKILAIPGIHIDNIVHRSSSSYVHVDERLGQPQNYSSWTKNDTLLEDGWSCFLQQNPEQSTPILSLWNTRVLGDFVKAGLDGPLATASDESVFALYTVLLSQRGGGDHETQVLGLEDKHIGVQHARDFFQMLQRQCDDNNHTGPDKDNSFAHGHKLENFDHPALRAFQGSTELRVLREILTHDVSRLIHDCIGRIRYMTLFKTGQGRIGIAPKVIRSGDVIALCSGLDLPVVMRPSKGGYALVAFAYVHGIMDGEAWPRNVESDLKEIMFV